MKMKASRQALVCSGGFLLALMALYEVLLELPVAWWLYAAVTVAWAAAISVTLGKSLPHRTLVVPIAGIIIAWVLYFVPWSIRKPFLRDLYSIQPGMNEDEVRNIMAGYMEGTGWPALYVGESHGEGFVNDFGTGTGYPATEFDGELAIKNSLVFRHSDDGAYNSDWGIVTLEEGRVVSVDFSPD
jgi:hypothetical protein